MKKPRCRKANVEAMIGNLFAHFDLASVAREPASALDSEKRHLLAIAAALSFSPAAIVADEPTKGLGRGGVGARGEALFSYDKQVVFATHDTDLDRPSGICDRPRARCRRPSCGGVRRRAS